MRGLLTDTTLRGPVRRAVMLDLLEGKVSEPARRLAAFACAAVRATDVPAALSWLANRTRHAGRRLRPGGDAPGPAAVPPAHRRLRHRAARGPLHRRLGVDGGRALPLRPDRAVHAGVARRPGRPRSLGRGPPGPGHPTPGGQGAAGHPRPGPLRRGRRAGPRHRGSLDWLVEQTAKARGWRIARVRAASPVEDAQQTELAESLGALAGAPVELQVVIDPSLLAAP